MTHLSSSSASSFQPSLRAEIMCGIPGAGKSTFMRSQLERGGFPQNAFILDPDRTMNGIPGYREALTERGAEAAFAKFEMAARTQAYADFDQAIRQRQDVIVDMGGVRQENLERVRRLKDIGYGINVYYIVCLVDVAIKRMEGRERFTPVEMIRQRHKALQPLLPQYVELADRFEVFDNSDDHAPFRPREFSVGSNASGDNHLTICEPKIS